MIAQSFSQVTLLIYHHQSPHTIKAILFGRTILISIISLLLQVRLKWAQTKITTAHSHLCRLLTLSCTRQDLQPAQTGITLERFLEGYKILDAIKGCSRQNHELCIQMMKKLMNMIEQLKALVIFLSSFNVKLELLGQCIFMTVHQCLCCLYCAN